MSSVSSIKSTDPILESSEYTPKKWNPLIRRQSFHSLKINNGTENENLEIQIQENQFNYSALKLDASDSPPETHTTLYAQLISALSENDDDETYEGVPKNGNIILDMDGTLGDCIPSVFAENPERFCGPKQIPRPGLRKFFRFVFSHYERVSIWTAASSLWYDKFKKDVLLPNMPSGANFHFERTRNMEEPYVVLKPLTKIYELYPEYNAENTTIIDDNVGTFADNRANAVHIPSFCYDRFGGSPETRRKNAAKDRGLFTIIEVLQSRIRNKNAIFESVIKR